jgi:hypothetical protein
MHGTMNLKKKIGKVSCGLCKEYWSEIKFFYWLSDRQLVKEKLLLGYYHHYSVV